MNIGLLDGVMVSAGGAPRPTIVAPDDPQVVPVCRPRAILGGRSIPLVNASSRYSITLNHVDVDTACRMRRALVASAKAIVLMNRTRALRTACVAAAMLMSGCGSTTPITPSNPYLPLTITSMTASSPRVETDGTIQLTAVVQADDASVGRLQYMWSASPVNGTFTGTGRQVTWQAPHLQPTPAVYTLTLTVMVNGRRNQSKVSSRLQVHYNNSKTEITTLSGQFLKDFTTFSVSPAECVRNFSDNCPGKAAELSDIMLNRQYFHINSGIWSVSDIRFNPDETFANITAPCTFYDSINATGKLEKVNGICLLTATYENWAWWLCDSHFHGLGTATNSLSHYMHP